MKNVFTQLPNDIIMRIIREADGGLSQHKINFKGVMSHFNSCVPVNFYPQVEKINDIMYYGYWTADPEQWYHDYGGEIMLSYQTIFEMKQDDYFNPDDLELDVDYDEIDIAFSNLVGYPVEARLTGWAGF